MRRLICRLGSEQAACDGARLVDAKGAGLVEGERLAAAGSLSAWQA